MSEPTVWVLRSDAMGGDGEATALAQALGWPSIEKRMVFLSRQGGLKRLLGCKPWGSLSNVNQSKSDIMHPPWPDLVIAVGRRQASVARWIKRQTGGQARLVQFQFPVMPAGFFDLIVSDAYPATSNVVHAPFPIMRLPSSPDANDIAHWQSAFQPLPKPWYTLLIGGPAKPYGLDGKIAEKMLGDVVQRVKRHCGSLLVTTSRRTPSDVIDLLRKEVANIAHLHVWSPTPQPNPFQAMMHLADQVIVTSDSVSMAIEAVRAQKPTEVYDLPVGELGLRALLPSRLLYKGAYRGEPDAYTRLADVMRRMGLMEMPDHLVVFQSRMRNNGHTTRFQDNNSHAPVPLPDKLPEIVSRVKKWFPQTQ
jgi:uncharacterized protein